MPCRRPSTTPFSLSGGERPVASDPTKPVCQMKPLGVRHGPKTPDASDPPVPHVTRAQESVRHSSSVYSPRASRRKPRAFRPSRGCSLCTSYTTVRMVSTWG